MDKHVTKAPAEIQQLLLNACARMRIKFPQIQNRDGSLPLMPTPSIYNHPLCKWTSLSSDNFDYVKRLALALCTEFRHRFEKPHFLRRNLSQFPELECIKNIPDFTKFPRILPLAFRDESKSLPENYRTFYIEAKNHLACWTGRPKPDWYPQEAVDAGQLIANAFKSARENGRLEINELSLPVSYLPD